MGKLKLRFFLFILFFMVFGLLSSEALEPQESHKILVKARLENQALFSSIMGALVYLEDTQIRLRAGKGHSKYDATSEGDGAKSEVAVNLPWKESISLPALPALKIRNRSGEWASFIHFLPKKTGFKGRNLVSVQDSNLFMTAFIAFPLFLYDDAPLPENKRFVRRILPEALKNIQSFKRGDAYNFWAAMPGVFGKATRSGPFNIPVQFVKKLGEAFLNPKLEKFWTILTRGLKTPPKFWVSQCLDMELNPTGADGLFNIPNDADDTSVAVAFQKLYCNKYKEERVKADLNALKNLVHFRDINRTKEDGRDIWKGKNTGAFLTWLKDERASAFATPDTGIMPLAVNNVDCVVNANVAFSMALNGLKSAPGYFDCLKLIADAVEKHAWPDAGLYYPQYMIFPYSASRAWRDGGAGEGPMKKAMKKLLLDLLREQRAWGKKNPKTKGSFPGGEDRSDHLSTALGLCTLLNIGQPIAEEIGVTKEYDEAVTSAVKHLLKAARFRKPNFSTTREVFSGNNVRVGEWESGLFFAASFWDLAHWRSQAYTVSMVLEALSKYALGYDRFRGNVGELGLKLIPSAENRFGMSLDYP